MPPVSLTFATTVDTRCCNVTSTAGVMPHTRSQSGKSCGAKNGVMPFTIVSASASARSSAFPSAVSSYAKAKVDVQGLTGDYRTDEVLSNKKVGLSETPDGYVWHHVENAQTMLLIPQDLHNAVRHTGGSAILK